AQPSLSNYRPAYQEDAKGNRTGMKWSADGKRLEGVVDAAYNETAFAYDAQDRLVQSTDAEGRITVYSYSQDERQPAEIITAQPESDLAINGDMELNYAWAGLNVPTSQARSDEQVAAGNYAWKVVADQGEGIESASDITFSEGKLYLLLAQVYVLNSGDSVTMGVANSSDWDATTETDGRWETLHALHKVTTMGGLTEKIQFSANHASTTFYVDAVQVLELSDVRWQQFVYDSQGRTLEEHVLDPTDGSALRSVEREYGTSGTENGLLQKITQKNVEALGIEETETEYVYDAQGRVIKTCKSSLMGTCSFTYTVYDEAGNVLGTACAVVNVTAPTTVEDLQKLYDATDDKKKLTRVTTHTYDALGRKISTITDNGEDSIFARENLTFYDALGRIVRTVQNYNAQSSAPGAWVYRAVSGEYAWRLSNTDDTVVSHGSDMDENIISDTDYNARGLVYRRRDVLGRVSLMGYDLADRMVKTINNASQPDYDTSYATGDPDLSAYVASSDVDLDMITEQVYDPNGNVVKSVDMRGSVTFTVLDALNRPVTVIRNAAQASYDILNDLDL
ncbi:MAG: hypothetical protein AAFR67_08545, partial [Chloroflexota bacterium]